MKSIKKYLSNHKSMYAAAKYHNVAAYQLSRLADAGAIVDESGQVWIKSKTVLNKQEELCQN